MKKILIADDEHSICEAFSRMIEMEGHQALIASNGKKALDIITRQQPDAVFMDVKMPGMDGLEALNQIQQQKITIPVVIMTAYGTMETAIEAIQKGAFDYLGKPVELDKARQLLKQMLNYSAADQSIEIEQVQTADNSPIGHLVGQSAPMQELFKLMGLLTSNDMTALITGESGVGKELVAHGIHNYGKKKNEPFIAVNCAAIPENLIESELFGHEKGAFSGAERQHKGRFECAGKGTIFLDEIGELSLSLQSKLLRVLQEYSFERVGSHRSIPLQARIIAATNRNLESEVIAKTFREDLYHRLNVITLCVPPLRQRKEDIELLAQHFLQQSARELSKSISGLDPEVIRQLSDYSWPGNVRELEHIIKRSVLLAKTGHLTIDDLQMPVAAKPNTAESNSLLQLKPVLHNILQNAFDNPADSEGIFHQIVNHVEGRLIKEALSMCNNNQVLAAKKLGLHRTTLRKKIALAEK